MAEYSDLFSQADENPLSSGGVWDGGYEATDNLKVVSNRVRAVTLGTGSAMRVSTTSPGNDQFVQFTIPQYNSSNADTIAAQALLRLAAPPTITWYEIDILKDTGASPRIEIWHAIAVGNFIQLGSAVNITLTAGDVFHACIRGNTIFVFQNGTLRRAETDGGTPTASGKTGLAMLVQAAGALSDIEVSNYISGDIRKTRFYLPNTGAPEISPVFTLSSSWTATTAADRIKMLTIKKASAMTTKVQAAPGTTANQKWLFRQYVSDPLVGSGTFFGTLFGQVRGLESAINDNIDAISLKLLVVTQAAGLRGALLALANYGTVAELNTSLRNKIIANGDALTAVNYQDGDRIVAEIGLTNTTTGTSVSGSMSFGDNNATDLTEDETDATAHNPWLEIIGMVAPIGGMAGPMQQMVNSGMVGNINV